jgi:hypothetical protein
MDDHGAGDRSQDAAGPRITTHEVQMSKAKYRTRCRVQRDEKVYLAGSEITLPEETAARLLAMNPPAIERIADAVAPTPPASRLNAKGTIALVEDASTVEALLQLEADETAHADGARKTVLDAIAARMAVLTDADDSGNADGGEGAEDA